MNLRQETEQGVEQPEKCQHTADGASKQLTKSKLRTEVMTEKVSELVTSPLGFHSLGSFEELLDEFKQQQIQFRVLENQLSYERDKLAEELQMSEEENTTLRDENEVLLTKLRELEEENARLNVELRQALGEELDRENEQEVMFCKLVKQNETLERTVSEQKEELSHNRQDAERVEQLQEELLSRDEELKQLNAYLNILERTNDEVAQRLLDMQRECMDEKNQEVSGLNKTILQLNLQLQEYERTIEDTERALMDEKEKSSVLEELLERYKEKEALLINRFNAVSETPSSLTKTSKRVSFAMQ